MESCRSALWVLLPLIITSGFESYFPAVKVKLHDSAVLPCSKRCSGVVRWTMFHRSSFLFTNPTDTLAECDQTSCRSVKEGYQMIHGQYLRGDLSLTITEADFSKTGLYTCECDGMDLCDVRLEIEAVKTSVQIESGDSLILKLDVSDPVEVIYSSRDSAGPSSVEICTVDGHFVQCRPEYRQRVSSFLELRGMKASDSGVYTVRDIRNDEVIHIYTVSVRDAGSPLDGGEGAGDPVWVVVVVLVVLMVAAQLVTVVVVWFNVQHRREIRRLRLQHKVQMTELSNFSPEEGRRSHSSKDQDQV